MRVFVSSTCYDLVDIRAEVAATLIDIGITPVLSDDKLSDFQHVPDVNSIERCLVNLDTCEAVILIVDSRYGGILPDHRISATELEYDRANENGIPVHFYIRDRTVAEYNIRKKTQAPIPTAWVKKETSERLFAFLQRHSALKPEGSNWYDTFTNSIDLKAAIRNRFINRVSAKRVVALIGENQFPIIKCKIELNQNWSHDRALVSITLFNKGRCPGFDVSFRGSSSVLSGKSDVLTTHESLDLQFDFPRYTEFTELVIAEYSDFRGVRVRQEYLASVRSSDDGIETETKLEAIRREFRRIDPLEVTFLDA